VGRRSKYPEEFRQRAAQLVLDSRRSVREAAGELGVNHETLCNWVAAERRDRADERMELARLRRKVAELELGREILKAAVFFTRDLMARRTVLQSGTAYGGGRRLSRTSAAATAIDSLTIDTTPSGSSQLPTSSPSIGKVTSRVAA
jgi:transposase